MDLNGHFKASKRFLCVMRRHDTVGYVYIVNVMQYSNKGGICSTHTSRNFPAESELLALEFSSNLVIGYFVCYKKANRMGTITNRIL